MKVKIWTVTIDGNNIPTETTVHASKSKAIDHIIYGLNSFGVARCKDGHRLTSGSLSELSELWEEAADGCFNIEEHEIEIITTEDDVFITTENDVFIITRKISFMVRNAA